jgi:hypothetical protein
VGNLAKLGFNGSKKVGIPGFIGTPPPMLLTLFKYFTTIGNYK